MARPETTSADTIAFVDGGGGDDTITDSGSGFVSAGFDTDSNLLIFGSDVAGNNIYLASSNVKTVAAGTITLDGDTAIANDAAGSTVTIFDVTEIHSAEIDTAANWTDSTKPTEYDTCYLFFSNSTAYDQYVVLFDWQLSAGSWQASTLDIGEIWLCGEYSTTNDGGVFTFPWSGDEFDREEVPIKNQTGNNTGAVYAHTQSMVWKYDIGLSIFDKTATFGTGLYDMYLTTQSANNGWLYDPEDDRLLFGLLQSTWKTSNICKNHVNNKISFLENKI